MWRRTDSIFKLLMNSFPQRVHWKYHKQCFGIYYGTYMQRDKSLACGDAVSEKIMNAESETAIQELITSSRDGLNPHHLALALEKLVDSYKMKNGGSIEIDGNDMPSLPVLCRYLIRSSRYMELKELISVIRSLSFLSVSSDSIVMQVLLQQVRTQINDLNLRQIIAMEIALGKMSSTPLVDAIRVALPIVAENHLDIQIQGVSFYRLVDWFCYGCKHKFSISNIRKIVSALLDVKTDWTLKDAINVLWGFVRLQHNFIEGDELFLSASKTLISKIDEVSTHDLLHLMKELQRKTILNVNLLKATSRKAMKDQWDFKALHKLASIMRYNHYLDMKFLNFYAEELGNCICNNTLDLPVDEIIFAFSSANVVPTNINALVDWVLGQEEQIKVLQSDVDLLVKFSLSLVILGVPPSTICKKVLGGKSLPYFNNANICGRNLADLTLLRTFMMPNYWNEDLNILKSPLDTHLSSCGDPFIDMRSSVKWALHKAVGNNYNIFDGVISKSGIFIDHILVKHSDVSSKSAYHTVHSNRHQFEDDYNSLCKVNKIAIVCLSPEYYASNALYPNGKAAIALFALKKEGFLTVTICYAEWRNIAEHEWIPYLQRAVNEAVNVEKFQIPWK